MLTASTSSLGRAMLDVVLLTILVSLTVAAFLPAVQCGFNLVDETLVGGQPHVRAGWSTANLQWALTTFELGYPIPVTLLSLMLDAQMFGLNAAAFHTENVAWHVMDVVLLYLLLRRLTDSSWRSAAVTALFAVHPLRAESVVWVTERKDVLAAFFGLLAMHAYVTYARRPSVIRYAAIVVLFAVSLLAKPMLVMLPVLLLGLDYWPLKRFGDSASIGRALLEKAPLAALAACCVIVGMVAQAPRQMSSKHLPFGALAANAMVSYVRYGWKMVWFRPLALGYPLVPHWPAWCVAGAVLILLAVTALTISQVKTRPWLAVGWAWYVVILLPAAGFYALGDSSIADRHTYFPMIGLLIMLAWSLPERLAENPWRLPAAAGFAAIVGGLIVATRAQVPTWRDDIALFGHSVRTVGPSELTCANLAIALSRAHRCAEAIPFYDQALRINPDNGRVQGDLAAALDEVGDRAAAVPHYRKAIESDPKDAALYYNLGTDLVDVGRPGEAVSYLRRAAELDAASIKPRANLATALLRSGDFNGAIEESQKALASQPNATGVRETLAAALARSGQRAAAEAQYLLAIVNDPGAANSYNELGALCLDKRELPAAIFYLREAVRLDPRLAAAHNNLGVALIAGGQVQEAAGEFRKALEIDPNYAEAKRNLELTNRMNK